MRNSPLQGKVPERSLYGFEREVITFPSFCPSFWTVKDFLRFLYKLSKEIIVKIYSSIALCLLNFLVGSTNHHEIKVWLSKYGLTSNQGVLEEKNVRSETRLLLWEWGYMWNDCHLHGFLWDDLGGCTFSWDQIQLIFALLLFFSSPHW